ncbi:MAG: regulatory protein RecX [Pseudomonadales bacterium]
MTEFGPVDVRRAAMDLLARREHSRQELTQKLERKFQKKWADIPQGLIEEEVDKLRQEGLQSDTRLAEALVRSRAGRGQGPLKIEAELRTKGVHEDVATQALERCGVDWVELITDVARKRFGTDKPVDARERAKRSRFLQQRGFSFEQISGLD